MLRVKLHQFTKKMKKKIQTHIGELSMNQAIHQKIENNRDSLYYPM